ncbi:hypothetical protein BTH41_05146 [Bacillus mycoides]|nr:hypothetical protein BTH41_05146 [Bacillus mycoides]
MLKKKIGLLRFIKNIIISIMQASKHIKNKLVVGLSIPLGTNNNNITLQTPIIPNNHSIHLPIPFPSHNNSLYATKCFTTSITSVNFSYATNPKATVKAVTTNPFMFSSSSRHLRYLNYKELAFCYHRTFLHLPYRIVRFQKKRKTT